MRATVRVTVAAVEVELELEVIVVEIGLLIKLLLTVKVLSIGGIPSEGVKHCLCLLHVATTCNLAESDTGGAQLFYIVLDLVSKLVVVVLTPSQ